MRAVRLRVEGAALDTARPQAGTVTIDRDAALFSVRPLHRRRVYELPLATVAAMVAHAVIKQEVAQARAVKRAGRRA